MIKKLPPDFLNMNNHINLSRISSYINSMGLLILIVFFMSGCVLFTNKTLEKQSSYKIEEIENNLKVGMTFDSLKKIIGGTPELLDNGCVKFKLKNGDLWVRCVSDGEKLKQVVFWGTIIRLPDGTTVKKTSKDQLFKKMLHCPICIDIAIKTEFNGEERTGNSYYEQYGPGNIIIKAFEKGAKSKEVSLILINGRYLLQKGDIIPGNEVKYLAGYMANLQLLQRLISTGMKEATPLENGRRSFAFFSKKEPFVIKILNKKIVYPAPWEVKGFVEPSKKKKGFKFNINFKVVWGKTSDTKNQITEFTGTFERKTKQFGDDIILSDWKQYTLSRSGKLTLNKTEFGSFYDMLK